MYLAAYIGEENKSIELQKLAWKVKLSLKMNESRHNQLKPKVLSYCYEKLLHDWEHSRVC